MASSADHMPFSYPPIEGEGEVFTILKALHTAYNLIKEHNYALSQHDANPSAVSQVLTDMTELSKLISSFDNIAPIKGWTRENMPCDEPEVLERNPSGQAVFSESRIVARNPFSMRDRCLMALLEAEALLARIRAGKPTPKIRWSQLDSQTQADVEYLIAPSDDSRLDGPLGRIKLAPARPSAGDRLESDNIAEAEEEEE